MTDASSPESQEAPKINLEAGTPEAALVIDRWWERFGPARGKLNVFDREENEQLDALEVVPAELEGYYDGIFRRHLADVQDLMVKNGIDFVAKAEFAEQETLARARIEIQGYTDQLTGLKNRRWLEEALDEITKKAKKNPDSNIWVLFADIDKFKPINTVFDHTGGDKILSLMGNIARKDEAFARFGGEEFVQFLDLNDVRLEDKPEATDEEKIAAITGRYSTRYKELSSEKLKTMSPKSTLKEDEIPEGGIPSIVTLSFGITKLQPGENSLQVLSRASTAVTEAKNAGRDRAFVAVPSGNEFTYHQMQQAA